MARNPFASRIKEVRTLTEVLTQTWPVNIEDPLRWDTTLDENPGVARLMGVDTGDRVYRLNFLSTPDEDRVFSMARYTYLGGGVIASVLRTNFGVDELFDNIGAIDERMELQRQAATPPGLAEYDNLIGMLQDAPVQR